MLMGPDDYIMWGAEISNEGLTVTADTTGANWTEYTSTANGITQANTWYHVVCVIDLPNTQVTFYVNGTKLGNSVTLGANNIYNKAGVTNYMGWRDEVATGYPDFSGKIDEVRVSNIARSAGWIATEYANQNSPSTFCNVSSEYVWNQTGTASWATAADWTPKRTTPASNDILDFNGADSVTSNNIPATQTIGQLNLSNGTTVALQPASGSSVLTISGSAF